MSARQVLGPLGVGALLGAFALTGSVYSFAAAMIGAVAVFGFLLATLTPPPELPPEVLVPDLLAELDTPPDGRAPVPRVWPRPR